MSSVQRTALIVASVVVLGVGFVIAQGGDDAKTPTTTTSAAPVTTTAASSAGTAATGATAVPTTTTTTQAAPAGPATPVITITGGQPVGGIKKLNFGKGDTVRFRVKSDVADEIHVHGYDVMKDVAKNGEVSFAFKGDIDGIFEIELEGAGVQIASLKVAQ